MAKNETQHYSGYIAIVGRPNVGKSTLLNCILGEKLSITSPKPQTTRHRILGIKTKDLHQFIYVDTPGLHRGETRALNRYMNRTVRTTLKDVDVILFMVEALKWTSEDEAVLQLIIKVNKPTILLVNKIDLVKDKTKLLPFLKKIAEQFHFQEIIPITATKGDSVETLEKKIAPFLPPHPHFFPEDQITDRSVSFRLSEMVREKLMRYLEAELPYGLTVQIELIQKEEKYVLISAIIWVEKKGHKPIVIGNKGAMLKKIGIEAREDMEKLLKEKVHLKLWVKVKDNWSDDVQTLQHFGYND